MVAGVVFTIIPVLLFALLIVSCHEVFAFRSLECTSSTKPRRRCIGFLSSSSLVSSLAASHQEEGANPVQEPALPRVLCLGDVLLDCIADWDARGLSVDEIMAENSWTAFPGGATANVAAACSKLGTPSAFAGCVGDDAQGDQLIEKLGSYGVDVSLMQQTDRHPTRRVMVTRSTTGDRAFGAFYDYRAADEFADAYLNTDILLKQAEPLFEQLQQSDQEMWMVCGTLSLAYPESSQAIRGMVKRCKSVKGCRLLIDVNWRPVFWKCDDDDSKSSLAIEQDARRQILEFCQQADVLKLTDEEAEWLLDIPTATCLENPSLVAEAFPQAMAVLVTAGEHGASYTMWGSTHGRLPAIGDIEVVETTGAGDAFTAGFLHQLLQIDDFDKATKLPLEERAVLTEKMIRFASVTGGLTCTAEGAMAAQPTFEQVQSYMECQGSIKQPKTV